MLRPSAPALSFFITLLSALAPASAETFTGPTYDLVLPDGWVKIPQDVVQRTMQQVGAGASSNVRYNFDGGFQLKGKPWFTYPYILVQTIPYPKEPSESEMRSL